jgi:hypothetical protein
MTVNASTRRSGPYSGTGLPVGYSFNFKVFAATDLLVVTAVIATGVTTNLVLDSGYSVNLNPDQDANPGGTVFYMVAGVPTALPIGITLTIVGNLPFTQPADITNLGGFYPQVIEDALDREVMLVQQNNDAVQRTLQLSVSTDQNFDVQMPAPVAANVLGWSLDGLSLVNYAPDTGISTALLETRLADAAISSNGAGMVAFAFARNYAVNTIGWAAKFVVQAAWFGAKGDGATDDYTALTTAMTYLNPNVWNASFNYQQGGGTLVLHKGIFRITQPLKLPPFVTIEGAGPDGWTGGGAGIGLTSVSSPPNGSAIFADFGATTETCAIDTQNWTVASAVLYAATNMTPITVGQLGGTYTYCQGVGLRNLAIFCTNQTRIGIRLQGAALAKLDNVSVIGFRNSILSNCVWSTSYRNLFTLSYQTGISMITNNDVEVSGVFDLMGWGSSNGSVITNNNVVTVGNKPAWWSANDTNYNGTSIYLKGCFGLRFGHATAQHCGRAVFAEAADVSFGQIYIEDLPFLSSGSTPGAFNVYNAAAGNTSLSIDHMHSDSNGVTLFNNLTNWAITLMNLSGIQGMTVGSTKSGTGSLLLGNNVNRNAGFGDFVFDPQITSLIPTTGTWTPGLTNVGGTGITAAGFWTRRGNIYDCDVVITGTALTATGGGATVLTTPFNGTGGFAAPARASGVAVTTANLQAASGLMDTNANLYISAITSTTRIVISFQLFGV